MEVLSELQTAWIRVRRRDTRRLIQIQAVCIWHVSYALRANGQDYVRILIKMIIVI